jgi:hypothetical protein
VRDRASARRGEDEVSAAAVLHDGLESRLQDDRGTALSLEIERGYDRGVIGLGIFSIDGEGG